VSGAVCPVCGSVVLQTMCTTVRAAIHRCRRCNHAFATSSSPASELYVDTYTGFRDDPTFSTRVHKLFLKHIAPRLHPGARVLDVGCGNGAFLRIAKDLGYIARGIDTSLAAVEACTRHGSDAARLDIRSAARLNERYDLITLWDVLEHITDPRAFLISARHLLRPGGSVLVKSPHVARRALLMAKAWPQLVDVVLQVPHHVQFFDRAALDRLLADAGFATRTFHRCGALRSPRPTRSGAKLAARALIRLSQDIMSPNLLVVGSVR
jgi:2-polyprenyl-3-methyl-5-hydroxy-6-metoxy-1,4-benzoquinol methylase